MNDHVTTLVRQYVSSAANLPATTDEAAQAHGAETDGPIGSGSLTIVDSADGLSGLLTEVVGSAVGRGLTPGPPSSRTQGGVTSTSIDLNGQAGASGPASQPYRGCGSARWGSVCGARFRRE